MDPDDIKTREMLNKCVTGMRGVKKSDIQELKALSNPPAVVALVMNGVMIALGTEATWTNAKK